MKKFFALVLAVLMVFSFAACSGKDTPTTQPGNESKAPDTSDKPTIVIGAVGTLQADGKFASMWENGYQLILKYIEENVKDANIKIEIRDMGADASEMKQRMTELKDLGAVAILGFISDEYGPAAAQWASENKTPVIYTANTSTEISITNYSDYIFCTGLNAWGFIKIFAIEAVKNRGYKNYAYVGSDGAAAIDAENLMLYEGQKIDPEFKCLASYRYAQTDTEFSTIVTTVMAMDPTPQMTLQQGGGNVVSFIQQASMYDFYGNSTIWSDVVIAAGLVQALVGAGVYSYEGSFGAGVFAWWDEKFQDFYDDYKKVSIAGYGTEDPPADFSLYTYWSGVAIVSALEDCIASGKDYKDGTVLTEALEKVSFESCGTEHHFRDIDHQLTMDIYFIEATDAGEEYHHYAKPKDPNAVYSADEYLPSKEEMKEYGEKVLGVKGRFD